MVYVQIYEHKYEVLLRESP